MNVLKEVVLPNINIEGLVVTLLDKALVPALNKLVADSATPIDDALAAMLLPVLEKALKEEIKVLVADLNK